ncbi:MAG: HDIG domain-containing metalloprotein [Planctomycetota bacterium]
MTCCFLLDRVRSRIKLLEVGGMTGLATAVAAVTVGMLQMESVSYTLHQSLYAAAAGLGSGGVVLCILPFIEKVFKVTTGLTLLEYQDHALLRRLALEAPGTYNHSLQVANLSEEAAAAIDADALLCRVACYYHDIGKLRKPDYFIENQQGGENRHMNLNPSMSLLVIIGHVKDGVAMAREYGLPKAFIPFIQQHHGTTLVEYFYREACQRQQEKLASGDTSAEQPVQDCDYRYPGPRPRTKETAIVMLADCCESAVRAMNDPTPPRIEQRVTDLLQKRLADGQLDECPLTMSDINRVRTSLVKSLTAVYHGRIQYPSDEPAKPAQPDHKTRIGADFPASGVAAS